MEENSEKPMTERDDELNASLDSVLPRILVVGVGGAGCNAVNRMIDDKVGDIDFFAVNTDAQALSASKAPSRLLLGQDITHGLGAGGQPTVGKQAAESSVGDIEKMVAGADMVFVAAGMGGGTGTGAAPVIAKAAMAAGALTVAIVTKPFNFEGRLRTERAASGLAELSRSVDSFIVVSNDKLMLTHGDQSSLAAFAESDRILAQSVKTITDLINKPGLINLDFADVRTILKGSGLAVIGFGEAKGENKAIEAARQAISSPLLEASIKGAGKALINITVSRDTTLKDIERAVAFITESTGKNDNVIFGEMVDQALEDEIFVAAIATGFNYQQTNETPEENRADETDKVETTAKAADDSALPNFLRTLLSGINKDETPNETSRPANVTADEKTSEEISALKEQLLAAQDHIDELEALVTPELSELQEQLTALKTANERLQQELAADPQAVDLAEKDTRIAELTAALQDQQARGDSYQARLRRALAVNSAPDVDDDNRVISAAAEALTPPDKIAGTDAEELKNDEAMTPDAADHLTAESVLTQTIHRED